MNSFSSRSILRVGRKDYEVYRLDALEKAGLPVARLPYSLKDLWDSPQCSAIPAGDS